MEKEKYKLIGILNVFDITPEFVYPVFEYDSRYYVQDRLSTKKIDAFELITKENFINNIQPLYKYYLTLPSRKYTYYVDDDVIMGFQLSENELFIGTKEEFIEYSKQIRVEDEFMKVELPYVIKKMKLEKEEE